MIWVEPYMRQRVFCMDYAEKYDFQDSDKKEKIEKGGER